MCVMTRLRGHFNGSHVVLDEPPPPELKVDTIVEVVLPDERAKALEECHKKIVEIYARYAKG